MVPQLGPLATTATRSSCLRHPSPCGGIYRRKNPRSSPNGRRWTCGASCATPTFKWAVRGAYKLSRKTREAAVEAQEQVKDIVAEVHAEDGKPAATDAERHT